MTPSESMNNGSSHKILNILGARLATNKLLVNDFHETGFSFSDTVNKPDDYGNIFGTLSDIKCDRTGLESC